MSLDITQNNITNSKQGSGRGGVAALALHKQRFALMTSQISGPAVTQTLNLTSIRVLYGKGPGKARSPMNFVVFEDFYRQMKQNPQSWTKLLEKMFSLMHTT